MLVTLILVACAPERIVISHSFDGCEDYHPDDPPADEVRVEEEDLAVNVIHDGVFQPSDALFDPEIALSGRAIEVHEYWTDGVEEETCFRAIVTIKDPEPSKYEVDWFLGETALETVEFKVD